MIARPLHVTIFATLAVVLMATPAAAEVDTTPPVLVSISVSPTTVDTSASSQEVTVTAEITDDLSGVSGDTELCSDGCLNGYDWFTNVSGDTWEATITWSQYSGGTGGIFRDWELLLVDNAGNESYLDVRDIYYLGFNLAVGVNDFDTSYPRTIHLSVNNGRAHGYVDASDASNCWWYVPVTLERKTTAGWKQAGSTLSGWSGGFRFQVRKTGKYRATASEFGLGTPVVTTCSSVRATTSYKG
jgi:hypothetical protein